MLRSYGRKVKEDKLDMRIIEDEHRGRAIFQRVTKGLRSSSQICPTHYEIVTKSARKEEREIALKNKETKQK